MRDASWQTFKDVFSQRYIYVHTDQNPYTSLHMARQGKIESPQEFTERYRALAESIACHFDDPVI